MSKKPLIEKIFKKWNKHRKILVFTDILTLFEFKKEPYFFNLTEEMCLNSLPEDMNRVIIPVYDRIPDILLEKEKIRNIPEVLIISLIKFRYENFKFFCFFQKRKKSVIRTKIHKLESIENLVRKQNIGVCLIFNVFNKIEIQEDLENNLQNIKIVKNTEEAVNFISQNEISVLNIIDTGDFERYICTNLGYRRIRKYSVYKEGLITTPKYVLEIRKSLLELVPAGVYHTFETKNPVIEKNEPDTSILHCKGVGLSTEIKKLSELLMNCQNEEYDENILYVALVIISLIEEFEVNDAQNFYTLLKISPFENRKYTQTLKKLIDDKRITFLKEEWPKIINDRNIIRKVFQVLKDKGIFYFPIYKRDKKTGKFYSTTIEKEDQKIVNFYEVYDSNETTDYLLVFQRTEDKLLIYLPL
jgi:hypothetical protein